MKKRILSAILVMAMTAAMLTACSGGQEPPAGTGSSGEPAGDSGSALPEQTAADRTPITIWTWDIATSDELNGEFENDTPDYSVELVPVEMKDMLQKLQTTMASGGQMPDIALLEYDFCGKLFSMDIWEDISKDPYNFDKDNVLDYLLPVEHTPDGTFVGAGYAVVGCLAYKRDLAKEYLGTDDRAELEAMLSDWDAFIEAGKRVQEKSNGEVFMFSSLGAVGRIIKGQNNVPFFNGDEINFDGSIRPTMETLVEMKKNGIVDVLEYRTPEDNASYADDIHIFYDCAPFSLTHQIKPNDPEGEGRWGMMMPPDGPYNPGYSSFGVPKSAVNKEGAVAYLRYFQGSEKGAELVRDYKNSFSPYKPVYEDESFYSKEEPWFGGQDILKVFAQEAFPQMADMRYYSLYDMEFTDAYGLALKTINAATDGDITADEVLEKMADDIMAKQPDVHYPQP